MTSLFQLFYRSALAPLLLATTTGVAVAAVAQNTEPVDIESAPAAVEPDYSGANLLIELSAKDDQVMSHLIELTSTFGPRLTGSTSLTNAGEWAKKRFASYGLQASTERWGEFPVGFDRGIDSGFIVGIGEKDEEGKPSDVKLEFITNAWSAGTDGPTRGRVVLEPLIVDEFDASLYEDAWILRRPRKERPTTLTRRKLDKLLAEAGMLGELRNSGTTLPVVSGNQNITWDDIPEHPSVRLVSTSYQVLMDQLMAEGSPGVEVEIDLQHTFVPGPIDLYNVIADIPGTEFPDEYVIVGGHLDSWGAAVGAQDNGTGCATTFEAARLLMKSGLKPRRTIRFMLWSGEEQGLFGSQAYAKAHPEVCDGASAVLVHDGGGNYLSGIQGPKALVDDLRMVFAPLANLNPEMPFVVRENRGLSTFGMSDHASFTQQGAPGFFWDQSGELDYNYVHHTLNDTVDMVNADYQRQSALVVAIGALGIANLDSKLDRTDLIAKRAPSTRNRRTMGVYLDENTVTDVIGDSLASKAKWKSGDTIIAIDGVAVTSRQEIVTELQKGDAKKVITLQRGKEKIESTLEWPSKKRP